MTPTVAISVQLCVPDWMKPLGHSDVQPWASECPDVKNHEWWLNHVCRRMLYSCTHMTTVGIKGLIIYLISADAGMLGPQFSHLTPAHKPTAISVCQSKFSTWVLAPDLLSIIVRNMSDKLNVWYHTHSHSYINSSSWGYRGGSPTTVQAWRTCPLWEPSPSHPIVV